MHILLTISVILVLLSSAFLTLRFENKKFYNALCYYFSLVFAQVVVTFEFLSIFSAIKPLNVVIINFLVFVIAAIIWCKKKNLPDFRKDFSAELEKMKFVLNHDKWLNIVSLVFVAFFVVNVFYAFLIPAFDGDAVTYHTARLPYWYQMCNLNHFEIADARALIMPINSEIFYMWAYSFIKSDIFVRFLSIFSFVLFLGAARAFLRELNVSMKVSLWTIFAVTSMYNVMFTVSSTETNLTIVAFIVSSLYLFLYGVKNDKKIPLYFATLAYGLAIGTKTPSVQMLPAFFVTCCVISYCYKKKDFYKPLLFCGGFLVLNFLIFGSYNYILNILEFGNPFSSQALIEHHRFIGGFKGFVSNIIRYAAMFVNFSGIYVPYGSGVQFSEASWRIVTALSDLVIALFGIDPDLGVVLSEKTWFSSGNSFENMLGLGVLGFLVFLPAVVIAFKKIKTSKRNLIIGSIGVGFVISMLILSCSLGYMLFSIRFIMCYVMCAFAVMIYMFMRKKNDGFKKVVAVIMIYSMTIGFYCFDRKFTPFLLVKLYKAGSINKFKTELMCENETFIVDSQCCTLVKMTKSDKKPIKVLYFPSDGMDTYTIGHAQDKNFSVDIKLLEKVEESDIDWDSYDYIAVPNIEESTYISDKSIDKFRKAVTAYNDGSDGRTPFYDFNDNMFANCIYDSSRQPKIKWMTIDKKRITRSHCYFKHSLFEKHGFKFIFRIPNSEGTRAKDLNIYVNSKK